MHMHGPSCLEGPISRKRQGWRDHENSPTDILPECGSEATLENNQAKRPIRWDLVARIRKEIEQGTYDTPEKMEIAMDRLLERLERE